MLIDAEEMVLAVPEVSGPREGTSPGTGRESGREYFPAPLQGSGRAQTGLSRAGIGTGSGLGQAGDAKGLSQTRSLHHPGQAAFRRHLGSMLKALGSIPEHRNLFISFFPPFKSWQ